MALLKKEKSLRSQLRSDQSRLIVARIDFCVKTLNQSHFQPQFLAQTINTLNGCRTLNFSLLLMTQCLLICLLTEQTRFRCALN
jgi:hypothetical protein